MKRIKLLLIMTFAMAGAAMAQGNIDFSDPAYAKWGEDVASREQNMFAATFMKEAYDNKDYNSAAGYFQTLMQNCPAASEAVMARAVSMYKARIARAKSLSDKKMMIDSLMTVHDLRATHFANHATRGRAYILDSKARDYFNYKKTDREGLREAFCAAIEANGAGVDPALVFLYFQNLCEDYSMDEVMAEDVLAEYDRLNPMFDNLSEEHAELRGQFDTTFGNSGVASCENLESIYTTKLAAAPDDVKVLAQAVKLMDRAGCKTTFYAEVAEKYYLVSPTSRAAMALATIFQNEGDFDKASKYLRDALAAETDMEEQEALYSRIALIEVAASRMSQALTAAKAALAIQDGTEKDNGIALFVIAQCYGSSAESCSELEGQIAYLAAYDMMQRALQNFTPEEESYRAPATALAAQFKAYFPTTEECFFNEITKGSTVKVTCGAAKGVSTVVRTRD